MMLEKASAEVTRNGVGVELLTRFYVREASWRSFTKPERALTRRVDKRFAERLTEAGFISGGSKEHDR